VAQRLAKQKITVADRELGAARVLRISPHFYNDEGELIRLIDSL
jgi:selenocysteine lyase/cysteine desulfurase